MLKPAKKYHKENITKGYYCYELKFHYPTNPFFPANMLCDWLHGQDMDKKPREK